MTSVYMPGQEPKYAPGERAAKAEELWALINHPTALADSRVEREAMELSLDLWPSYDFDGWVRHGAMRARGNAAKERRG